jgi:dTDP-glucose pyrophosphorylase
MGAAAVQTVEVLATEIADLKMIVPRIHRDQPGELEITDANNFYVQEGTLACERLSG